jgi:hypothetical protein
MRRFFAAAVVLALCPSFARAVITIRPGDAVAVLGQAIPIEVFADPTTLTPGVNEHLNAYTMTMSLTPSSGQNQPSFVVPANFTFDINSDPNHQYVFTAADPPFDPTGNSSGNLVFLSAAPGTADTDLTEIRNGFGKVMMTIPANLVFGTYTIRIDNDFLSLGGSAGTIEAVGGTATFTYIPEPAAAGVTLAAAPLFLRRRRIA